MQWKIIANSLADLTNRENRFAHYGYRSGTGQRQYPFAAASAATGSGGTVEFVTAAGPGTAQADANNAGGIIVSYTVTNPGDPLTQRPFVYVMDGSGPPATANAMLDYDEQSGTGRVVHVVHGPVPLWGPRRGEDVMLTDVLAFDLRVYDPGAPIYQDNSTTVVLEPPDLGWNVAYNPTIGASSSPATTRFVGQGAYGDMGYSFHSVAGPVPPPAVAPGQPWALPSFAVARALSHVSGMPLAPGFAVYDTWSLSYENNGIDDDGDGIVDEGTNGLDDDLAMGPDDVGERETAPPYDVPLRGVQVLIRVYERDARQIRQVRVNQHFLTE
jgi:hypothetical protein